MQLHARLELAFFLAVLADAHVAGGDADHGTRIIEQHFCCGKAGVNFHA